MHVRAVGRRRGRRGQRWRRRSADFSILFRGARAKADAARSAAGGQDLQGSQSQSAVHSGPGPDARRSVDFVMDR